MKDTYVYPAVLTRHEGTLSVEFPDLPGCLTCGGSVEDAMSMAREALALHVYGMEDDGDPIPEACDPADIVLQPGQYVALIDAWMPVFRARMQRRTVNKMLTLPKWLNDLAEHEKINFSGLLQEALKQRLGVSDPPPTGHRRRSSGE